MQVTKSDYVKNAFKNTSKIALAILLLGGTSGCVTQNYSEDKPVVDRDFSDEQMAKTRISLALGYLKIGSTAQAKQNLEKAKRIAPRSVEVYTAFAHYYESVGEYEQAEKAYLKALDLNDEDADTLNNFGVFLCRQNRVEEAESYFLKAIKVPSYIRVSESYENIALCYMKEHNFEKAEHGFERSIAHSPNSASSLFQMAQVQYAKGQLQTSAKYLNRFEMATRRFTPEAIALAFKVNQKLGQDEIAQNYVSMLLEMFPESYLAKQYIDNGLAQIEADNLAFQYRKYKLLKSGVKVNAKPKVVSRKKMNKNDGLSVNKPDILIADEKLVKDETIIDQTSQSIARNSQIANHTTATAAKPQTLTTSTTKTPNAKQTVQPPVNKPVSAAPSKVSTNKVVPQAMPKVTTNVALVQSNATNSTDKVHVVQQGENLYKISVKYNIMISSLRRWNDLTKETIHVGQVLRLSKPE